MAVSFGLDPLAILALEPFDWTVMVATLNVAAKNRADQHAQLIDALSNATAKRTISALGKAMK